MAKALRNAAASTLALLLRALIRTVRYRVVGWEAARTVGAETGGFVLALWHESIMTALGHDVRRGATALVSPGSDGTFATRLVAPFGVAAVRGSRSRDGAAAVRTLLDLPRNGGALVVTPDGPRGPRRRAHLGAAYLASRSGSPIVPLGIAVRGARRLRSWDRFIIPLPFATAFLVYGPPLYVAPGADREKLAAATAELEAALSAATAEACRNAGLADV